MNAPRIPRRSFAFCAGMMVLALSSSTLCLAQSSQPPITPYVATAIQVKPDMLNEWLDLQKNEVVPALKKAGVSSRAIYATTAGDNYEYVEVRPADKFASLDGPGPLNRALGAEAAARLIAKLRKCLDGQRSWVFEAINELSSLPPPNAPPLVGVSTRVRVAPGRTQDYENFVKTDIVPVYRKAKAEGKIAGYWVTRRSLGANAQDRTLTVYYNKFADLDGGPILVRMLGQAEADRVLAKVSSMRTPVEAVVRRRVADLSYGSL